MAEEDGDSTDVYSDESRVTDILKSIKKFTKLLNFQIKNFVFVILEKGNNYDLSDEDPDNENDENDDDEDEDDLLKFPIELPSFSKKIHNCLQSGNFWHNSNERSQLVSELAVFYKTSGIILRKSCHYKVVALTLFSNYEKFKSEISDICDSENQSRKRYLAQPWVNIKCFK